MREGDCSGRQATVVTASQRKAGEEPPKETHCCLWGSEAAMCGGRHKAGREVHAVSAESVLPSLPSWPSPTIPGRVSVLAESHSGWMVGTG